MRLVVLEQFTAVELLYKEVDMYALSPNQPWLRYPSLLFPRDPVVVQWPHHALSTVSGVRICLYPYLGCSCTGSAVCIDDPGLSVIHVKQHVLLLNNSVVAQCPNGYNLTGCGVNTTSTDREASKLQAWYPVSTHKNGMYDGCKCIAVAGSDCIATCTVGVATSVKEFAHIGPGNVNAIPTCIGERGQASEWDVTCDVGEYAIGCGYKPQPPCVANYVPQVFVNSISSCHFTSDYHATGFAICATIVRKSSNPASTGNMCSQHDSCTTCSSTDGCGWCFASSSCKQGTLDKSDDLKCSKSNWMFEYIDNLCNSSQSTVPVTSPTTGPSPEPTPSPGKLMLAP